MADGAYVEIKKKLDTIIAKQTVHGENLARIDEHLKTLNGTVARHDGCIIKIQSDSDALWGELNRHVRTDAEFRGMVTAKLAMVGLGSGSVAALIVWLANIL
jgi:hypothetical protein